MEKVESDGMISSTSSSSSSSTSNQEDKHAVGIDVDMDMDETCTNSNGATETAIATATATVELKRKNESECVPVEPSIFTPTGNNQHEQYWRQKYAAASVEGISSDELITLIHELPYINDSTDGEEIVRRKDTYQNTYVQECNESDNSLLPVQNDAHAHAHATGDSIALTDEMFVQEVANAENNKNITYLRNALKKESETLRKCHLEKAISGLHRLQTEETLRLQLMFLTYLESTTHKATITSQQLTTLSGLSQANSVASAQNTFEANKQIEEKRLKIDLLKEHRNINRVDSHVYERFADPERPRNNTVNTAMNLEEYSITELKEKDGQESNPDCDFIDLYSQCFEIASFLALDESWCDKNLYQECLDRTLEIFKAFARAERENNFEGKEKEKICLKNFQTDRYKDITKFVTVLRMALKKGKAAPVSILKCKFLKMKSDDVDESDWNVLKDKNLEEDQYYRVCKKYVMKFSPEILWLPGPSGDEDIGVQPLFEDLLRCIAAGLPSASVIECEENNNKRHSPKKGHLVPKMSIVNSESRAKRIPDITIWTSGKHIRVMDDDNIRLIFELKPLQRKGKFPLDLFHEGLNQGLSHSSKSLMQALNFGPGLAAHCTFVVATPVYIRVMKLRSVSPGTPKSKVQLEWSEFLPLVSKEGFERFYQSDRQKFCGSVRSSEKMKEFSQKLYGHDSDDDDCYHRNAFFAIRKLMKSTRQDLVGTNMTDTDLIGCGTFGTILSKGDDDVLKVSKHGRIGFLLDELQILLYLHSIGESKEGSANVIKYVRHGRKKMAFGSTKISMECLHLKPRGASPYSYPTKELKKRRDAIAKGLKLGLKFLHSNGIVHNDLSFQNFIIHNYTAVIIDLGSAQPEFTKMKTKVGTPNFTHNEPLTRDTWFSLRQYDQASLAYVIRVVDNGGEIPWTPIEYPYADYYYKERDESTMIWLRKVEGMNSDIKDYLKAGICFEQNGEKTQKPRTSLSTKQNFQFTDTIY